MFQIHSLRQGPALRPLTTAHLAQTMTLLEMTAPELNQKIEAELAKNPALELRESHRCSNCRRHLPGSGPCPRCTSTQVANHDEPVVFVSPRQDFYLPGRTSPDELPDNDVPQAVEDLPIYVLRQIAPELKPDEYRLAAYILNNLDKDGLLEVPLAEIARYHHLPLSHIQSVLRLIQRADPLGVGSPTPQEALLAQLDTLAESQPVPHLAAEAIHSGLDLLSRRQYLELGRLLGISSRQAERLARFISDNLNPFPARAYWGDVRQGKNQAPEVYSSPDVIISCLDGTQPATLLLEVVSPYAGLLYVNPLFRQAISEAPTEKAEQWRTDLEQAELLVKCLQQRTHTIVRLMRRLAVLQRDFILQGDGFLQPVTRASLAKELEVHESTISRAVSDKSVQLPSGHIIPLARFFDRSLQVRTILKQIIAEETQPFSDTVLVELLNQQGYHVARRTVAKYRAMEGILPSHLRVPGPFNRKERSGLSISLPTEALTLAPESVTANLA
ncbi:MAG TPA: hypothetical protein VJ436_14010 [Anaerolineales bacterium]|nr:hypothetical protein [Anaerolineales bacterium]